jgi:hypothetical protein
MSTTRRSEHLRQAPGVRGRVRTQQGLCAVELLLGLLLGLSLVLAVLPLWGSWQRSAAAAVEDTVWSGQSRVAAGRLERDLRWASADGVPFALGGPLLYASASQLVIVTRKVDGSGPIIVEWELVGGALMRRWGPCPATKPVTFPHSLYLDNKTMLERVLCSRSAFTYGTLDGWTTGPLSEERLALVEQVVLRAEATAEGQPGGADSSPRLVARARVGR